MKIPHRNQNTDNRVYIYYSVCHYCNLLMKYNIVKKHLHTYIYIYIYIYVCICYSYIPLRVGYHCYYTSPR